MDPSIKMKDDRPDWHNIKIRMCMNGKQDSIKKLSRSHSPTWLVDSFRFTLSMSAYFSLNTLAIDVADYF